MNKKLIGVFLSIAALAMAQEGASRNEEPQAYKQEGIASWYGAEFEGRTTASGEIFDSRLMTAAHPSLPFGTVIRVTNTHNGKTVTLRVNDRGPFVAARILDVSRAAAEKLDMIATGTAPIRLETISPLAVKPTAGIAPEASAAVSAAAPVPAGVAAPAAAPASAPAPATAPIAPLPQQVAPAAPPAAAIPEPAPLPAAVPQAPGPAASAALPVTGPAPQIFAAAIHPKMPDPNNGKKYRVQIGSYKLARNAVDTFNRLQAAGLNPAYERYNDLYRVVLAGIPSNDVGMIAERLGAAGFPEALIREEP